MEPFAWPISVVIIALFFMVQFKEPIGALLSKTKKIGKSGLETHDYAQIPADVESKQAIEEFMATFDNPLLKENEDNIDQDLAERGLTGADAQRALVRSLAGTQILLGFEKVQTTIFASQIDLLTHLNGAAAGIDIAQAVEFFDDAAAEYPNLYENRSFEEWLTYLSSWGLVGIEDQRLTISQVGREFLKWRLSEGRIGPAVG